MLLIPSVDAASHGSQHRDLAWWITYTPLHAAWAGEESVVVFFVLSGFVLTRSFDSASFSWRAYYPSRLLRLYLPVFGALLFAAATVAALPRSALGNASNWLNGQRPIPITIHGLAHDAVLLRGPGLLDPPLWSLQWEVIFSLLLPLAVYGASRRLSVALASGVILLAIARTGGNTSGRAGYLLYLPMFGIGALMLRQHHILAAAGRRLKMWSGSLVVLAGVVLLTLSWTARDQFSTAYRPEQVVGAALLVFAFGYWERGQAFGGSAALQWLGKRSYSLYLIHYPILVGIAYSLGQNSRFTFLIGIPIALVAADGFFRGVEGPSHRLAQKLKRSLTTASHLPPERAAPTYGVQTDS